VAPERALSEAKRAGFLARLGVARPERWGPVLARLAVTAATLGLLFWWIPIGEVTEAILGLGLGRWLGVVALFGLIHGIAALKWSILVRASGTPLRSSVAVRAHAAGLFANIWLPSIVGGDLVRAGIAARSGGQIAGPTAAGIADRVLDLVALVALAAIGLSLAPAPQDDTALRVLQLAVAALVLGVVGGLLVLRFIDAERLPVRPAKAVRRLREATLALASRGKTTALAFGISLAVQGSLSCINDLLGAPIGIDCGLAVWAVAWPLAKVAAFLPVSLGGIGVREAALAALLATFGVDPALALAQGLLWRSGLMALGLIGGVVALFVPKPPEDDAAGAEPERA
jgi:uncharacterized membrane protein YbhN (UPF0104 family)